MSLANAIDLLRTENKEYHNASMDQTDQLNRLIGSLVDEIRGSRLDAEEARREQNRSGAPAAGIKPVPTAAPKESSVLDTLGGVFTVVGIVEAITGLITGVVERLGGALRSVGKVITNKFSTVGSTFVKVVTEPFQRQLTNLGNAFTSGRNGLKGLSRGVKGAFRPLNGVEKVFNTIGKAVTSVTNGVSNIGKFFSNIGTKLSKFFKSLDIVRKSVSILGSGLERLFGVFRSIGRFIALPVTIAMALYDGITTMFSKAEEQEGFFNKYVAGLGGLLTGIIQTIVGAPLDLLKDLTSWIIGKLGFDGASEALDSFSFDQLIEDLFDGITSAIISMKDYVVELFNNPMEKIGQIGDVVNDFLKSIVRMVLPTPDPNGNWYDPVNLAAKAIPQAVYDWAGAPSSERPDLTMRESVTASMNEGISANQQLKSALAAVEANIVNAPSQNTTTNVNNNTSMMTPNVPANDPLDRGQDW